MNKRQFKSFMNQLQAELTDVSDVANSHVNKLYDFKNLKRYPRLKSGDFDQPLETIAEVPSSKRAQSSAAPSKTTKPVLQFQKKDNSTEEAVTKLRYETFF